MTRQGYQREYYLKNRDKILAAEKARREDDPDAKTKARERGRKYNARYADARRAHYLANREKIQSRAAAYDKTPNGRLTRVKSSAKKRNIEWSLPDALALDLITDNCFYCGVEPNLINGIDRVDNEKGYVEDNVVTCCSFCNFGKRHMPRADFEQWILRAAEHLSRFYDFRV